jgi:putative 2OG-Fe(II) oxygenase
MDSRVEDVIEVLRREGFAKFSGVLQPSTVTRLQRAGEDLATHASKSWSAATDWYVNGEWDPTLFADAGQSANYYDSLGVDAGLDQGIEEVIATPEIRELLDAVVGVDRRMWFVQLRWARPGSDEYPIHQDVYGELGLCVYLSDHLDGHGSMVLWPKSHRWPRLLEGFPLLMPKWVPESVGRVDGVAGDICVFFNKTWHGRTTAVDAPRLVMLISFIPPGPIELPRRLPETARVGLGPELRKITAPEAARSFGQNPPTDPHLSSSLEMAAHCPVTAATETAIREYVWGWSRSACDGDAADAPLAVLRRYETFVTEAMRSAVVPPRVIDFVLEDFRGRTAGLGLGPRTYHYLNMSVAQWNGDQDLARREFEAWRALPRDELSDTPEAELESIVRFHADRGEDREALDAAEPLLAGELAGELAGAVPGTAWSHVLIANVRSGRTAEAAHAHAVGYPQVRGHAMFTREIGAHLEYAALLGDPEPGLEILCEHLGPCFLQHNQGGLWRFWSGAWLLFARMERAGRTRVERSIPRLGAGPFETGFLAGYFEGRLRDLAERLDRRNGHDHRARAMRDLATRLGWKALP